LWCHRNKFGRTPYEGSPAEPWKSAVAVQAARRRALALRAAGRRVRFAVWRRALPERLETVRFAFAFAFALRAGRAFFFAIFAIGILSFSFPSFSFAHRYESQLLKTCENVGQVLTRS
jgi:hypothetical protein